MSGFKWKSGSIFQISGRQKGQAHIRWLGRCCWAAKSLTRSQSGWRRKTLLNKTLDKFKFFQSLLADSQEHHGLRSAIPMFRFALVPLRFAPVPHIPARRHRYLECWQHVVNAPNISQSYFCVVRATHNSNSWVVPPFARSSPPGFRAAIFFSRFSFASRTTN